MYVEVDIFFNQQKIHINTCPEEEFLGNTLKNDF